jgi:hypothetical protein
VAAAHHTELALTFSPSAAVKVRCFIIFLPTVLGVFLHVAMHVMQTEGIGWVRADRQGLLPKLAWGRALIWASSIEIRLI